MRRVMLLLVAGTLVSGVAAYAVSAKSRVATDGPVRESRDAALD